MDLSWNITAYGAWTTAEISIGLICASLPVFPKFFQTIRKDWSQRFSGRDNTSGIRLSKLSRPFHAGGNGGKAVRNWDDDSCLRTYDILEEGHEVITPAVDNKVASSDAIAVSSTR